MEKPHAGLDDWLRMLQACFRKRMSGIRVDDITQYMCDPLRKCLRDEDPYVRKTAAISVAKLYDISPQLVEEHGFIDLLQDLFSDSNPMVVSNAVAALSDISEASANGRPVLDVGPRVAIQLAKKTVRWPFRCLLRRIFRRISGVKSSWAMV